MGVSLVSSFTGAASQNMACFIAGTKVLTVAGLVAIENIKAGDMVISTNPDTLETDRKMVLESYVRQVDKLVHLKINGEEIVTTDNHPFYVQGRGFINAGGLLVGDKLVSVNGEDLTIEDYYIELTEESVSVYNFQVEDFHTYFVGDCTVWVHNKNCTPENRQSVKEHLEGTADNTGVMSNGSINGCHEENKFLDVLDNSGGDLTDTIESINGIDGVNYVEYKTSSGDIKKKTIYDSSVISTDDYINRGLEAYARVPESVTGGSFTYADNSGTNWSIFIRNNKLITIFPVN